MDLNDGLLFGNAYSFQKEKIRLLDTNEIPFPDITWEIDGKLYYDTKSVYNISSFFVALFRTSLTREIRKVEGIEIFTMESKLYIFEMIRVFCHTGLVRFSKGESILKTLERYSAFHYYDISAGKDVLRNLISDKLIPANATQAFEFAICRDDIDLRKDITEYIINYANLVFNHRNFLHVKMESMSALIEVCSSNSLNITELDLLECLYKLCQKKISEKEYVDFKDPMEIMKFKFGDKSLWECIRLESIQLKEFMDFLTHNQNFMNNDDIVSTMKHIHNPTSFNAKRRKKFQQISSYPRNLNFGGSDGPRVGVSHWDRDKVQVFFAFDFSKGIDINIPPVIFRDWTVRCQIKYVDKHLCLKGSFLKGGMNINLDEAKDNVVVTTKFVNFVHARWKRSVVEGLPKDLHDFEIPNMISCNAIEGGSSNLSGGYLFDVNKYPDYIKEGTFLLMCLSIEVGKIKA